MSGWRKAALCIVVGNAVITTGACLILTIAAVQGSQMWWPAPLIVGAVLATSIAILDRNAK